MDKEKEDEKEIKVPHPEYGHVIFSRTTIRQSDVLADYLKLINKIKRKRE